MIRIFYKDKVCFKCGKKGHPKLHCPAAENNATDTSSLSRKDSLKDLEKQVKKIKQSFTQLKAAQEDKSSEDEAIPLSICSLLFHKVIGQ